MAAEGCEVTPEQLLPCLENLAEFAARYAPHFRRREQREHAATYLEGLLSNLPRKTVEPIAMAHDQDRHGLQRFVGEGAFDNELLIAELKRHVAETIGDPAGVLIVDPTCVAKKGTESVGVQHQWNGRLGKEDNCQKAVLLAYASPQGFAMVDRQLYLPKCWIEDDVRREKCRVPPEATFKTSWQQALELIDRAGPLSYAWVVADDEFGRPSEFRAALRARRKCYALDVPSNTSIRPIHAPRQPRSGRRGRPPGPRTLRASDWARERKSGAWVRVLVRDGTKGPRYVLATEAAVETRFDNFGCRERLIAIKTIGPNPEHWYVLSNAPPEVSIGAIVCAHATRHSVELAIEQAKGEAGLAQYEVRSWTGWHHHVTFSLLASWFLTLEQLRFREADSVHDGPAGGQGSDISRPRSAARLDPPGKAPDSTAHSNRGGSNVVLAKARSRTTAPGSFTVAVS